MRETFLSGEFQIRTLRAAISVTDFSFTEPDPVRRRHNMGVREIGILCNHAFFSSIVYTTRTVGEKQKVALQKINFYGRSRYREYIRTYR